MQAKKSSNMSKSSRPNKRNAGQRPRQAQAPKARGGRGGSAQFKVQTAPVALGNLTFQSKPRYQAKGENLVVSHCEYIADITGSTSVFSIAKTFAVNPGIAQTFPWLNQIASRYESYRFKKLSFMFRTERPTTESGYVVVVPDFDPTDAGPADKQTAFQFQGAAQGAPWQNITMFVDKANLRKRQSYFNRQGALLASENLALYDTANIFVCVGGNSGAVTLGQLWCDYEVELMTPQLDSNYGASDSAKVTGGGTMTAASIFGSASSQAFSRGTLWTLDAVTGTLTFLQNFQGVFAFNFVGTGISSPVNLGGTATSSLIQSTTNGTNTNITCVAIANALVGQTLILTLAGATTLTTSVMRVGAYQYSL